jgi:hypothetical protein
MFLCRRYVHHLVEAEQGCAPGLFLFKPCQTICAPSNLVLNRIAGVTGTT